MNGFAELYGLQKRNQSSRGYSDIYLCRKQRSAEILRRKDRYSIGISSSSHMVRLDYNKYSHWPGLDKQASSFNDRRGTGTSAFSLEDEEVIGARMSYYTDGFFNPDIRAICILYVIAEVYKTTRSRCIRTELCCNCVGVLLSACSLCR